MIVCRTPRLVLRWLEARDADFIAELLNDPAWIEYIGDKNIRTLDDARNYIANGPVAMYAKRGFGLNVVELADGGARIGICGLIKRDSLDDVDLGFAFLPAWRGMGYAHEAALATLQHGERAFGLPRVAAITSPANVPSIRLLESLGFAFVRTTRLTPGDPGTNFYLRETPAA